MGGQMDRKIPTLAEEHSHSEQCCHAVILTFSLKKGAEKIKWQVPLLSFSRGLYMQSLVC